MSMGSDFSRNLLSSSSSTCRNCLYYISQKWCISRYSSSNQGECCSTTDYSGYCYGQGSYVCSNDDDIEGTPGTNNNGGYIMCPSYSSDCGTLSRSFYYHGQSSTFEKDYIPSSVVCVYQVTSSSAYADSLKIEVKNATGVDINVYTSSSSYNYDKEGSMYWNDTKTVSLSTSTDVYIMVHPTSSSNGVEIDVELVEPHSEIAAVALVFIIIGSICCFVAIVVCIVFGVIYCVAKGAQASINNQGRANNMAAAAALTTSLLQSSKTLPLLQTSQPTCCIRGRCCILIPICTRTLHTIQITQCSHKWVFLPTTSQEWSPLWWVRNPIAPVQPPENKLD
ncbi:unnamed protein product [Moneuplotes crassus]|uniref:Uncharacterized protein n=1 Tax=Euplotes crassus TaxID=5936 RepID=A0AAD1X9B7_EUPCR|nr:unnamed protein product [Moneuplotes crassus]